MPWGIIAVSDNDLTEFGCPHCGYRFGSSFECTGGSSDWECKECGKVSYVLAEGVTRSALHYNGTYPELLGHPRRGIPGHGDPDIKPVRGIVAKGTFTHEGDFDEFLHALKKSELRKSHHHTRDMKIDYVGGEIKVTLYFVDIVDFLIKSSFKDGTLRHWGKQFTIATPALLA